MGVMIKLQGGFATLATAGRYYSILCLCPTHLPIGARGARDKADGGTKSLKTPAYTVHTREDQATSKRNGAQTARAQTYQTPHQRSGLQSLRPSYNPQCPQIVPMDVDAGGKREDQKHQGKPPPYQGRGGCHATIRREKRQF